MGNFKNIEHDFVGRTMKLISQYEIVLHDFEFENQYNYTLLLNCMLGIIVMPKDRVFSHIPNPRITNDLKSAMGLTATNLNPEFKFLRDFIYALRNSVAHFSIKIISETEDGFIDRIQFLKDDKNQEIVADFTASELLPFMRYYASWLQTNLIKRGLG